MKKRLISALLALALLCSTLPLNALAAARSIRFSPKVRLMYNDQSVKLTPKLTGVKASELKWKSSKTAVATVSKAGKVSAKKSGLAVISASAGGTTGKCGIISLPRSVSVKVGQTKSLPYASVAGYSAANSAVAKVSKKGVITGKKAGTTAVTVKYGSQKLKVKVTVKANAADSRVSKLACAATAKQIVLVEYTGGSGATLSLHEKVSGHWKEVYSCNAYVGKNGIDKTKEGDKRTPTGTFNLTTPFGIKADPGAKMGNYTKVTKYHYWCGTSGSKYYNQLIDTRVINRERTSADEYLIRYTGVYNYCLFIDYNANGTAGKGSCIFLHCMGSNPYTAGCVAIPEASMIKVLKWAKAGTKIAIGKPL